MFSKNLLRAASTPILRPIINRPVSRIPAFVRFQSTLPRADVQSRILTVFHNFLGNDKEVSATATFQDLGLDSLDAVELMVAVEEEFGIEIPDTDSDEIKSVSDAVEYISAQSAAR
ncbi:acyl carrier protein [Starmerella bacillaris]|uniref:Acyl carrier protein n=1 Tax=Starmerella bacillaris TaxID=1247836 RepID=A0AAV5RGK7_STABA|nr:acyl carrier protein [Starmerella bacillaris]